MTRLIQDLLTGDHHRLSTADLKLDPKKIPLNLYERLQKATPIVPLKVVQSGNEVGEDILNEVGEER